MSDTIAADMLRLFVERIERLTEERKGIQDDIKDVFLEAKAQGFDGPALRECIKLRALEKHTREEKQALVQLYGEQLGLF